MPYPIRPRRSRFSQLEQIESRTLFAAAWGPTATLVNQDDAASTYSSIKGDGITVAVIDSGINYNVSQLGGGFGKGHKVVAGFDFVDDDSDPMDTDGHGTEVAGVIAADPFTLNGQQYSGVAPDADLVALRVTHGEDGAADATIEKALDWVIDNYSKYNIKVINISLGSGNYASAQTNATLSDEFAQLADLHILVVAASGNSGDSLFGSSGVAYPAADANVVAVGAVNAADDVSGFTQRGSDLDLLAPGENVATVTRTNTIEAVDGTSFASPYVAGTAALIFQTDTSLKGEEVLSILRASGKTNKDGDTETGRTSELYFPRLDIYNAITLANARVGNKKNTVGTGAVASDIAYDAQGVLYLAYYDASAKTIRYATRDLDGQWSKTTVVDKSGADVGVYLSIAIDATGKPGIAYFDNTNSDLKYAHFNGGNWDVRTLDSSKSVGQFPSLVYDTDGDPVVSYYRKSGGDLKLQTIGTDGNWTRLDVDSDGDVGAWSNVAVADNGVVAVAYADQTNGDLKYARYLDGAWTLFTVDDLAGGAAYVDLNLHNNQAFISYQDLANGDLKFAKRENSQWMTETVYTPGNTGQFSHLVFDSTDTAHIVFYSKSKNLTYEASGSFGSWSTVKIGSGGSWLSATASADESDLLFVGLTQTKKGLQFGGLV